MYCRIEEEIEAGKLIIVSASKYHWAKPMTRSSSITV